MARKKEYQNEEVNRVERKDGRDILKPKERTTSKTVELETIKEEKSMNYSKNKKIFIVFTIISILLFIYIIYLVVFAFIG